MTAASELLVSPSTQHGVGALGEQHLLRLHEDAAQHGAETGRVDVHVAVGCAKAEVVEEHLVERMVVVLTGVDEHVLDRAVEQLDRLGETDDLGAGPHDRHHLGHRRASSSFSSGIASSSCWVAATSSRSVLSEAIVVHLRRTPFTLGEVLLVLQAARVQRDPEVVTLVLGLHHLLSTQ